MDRALELFNLMTDRAFEVRLPIYKALICALLKANQVEKAQVLFENMLEKQWNPDEIIWTLLVDGLLKDGMFNLCLKFLHVMESKKGSVSLQAYVVLERELSKLGGSSAANAVSEKLKTMTISLSS